MAKITFTNSDGELQTIEKEDDKIGYNQDTHHWVVTVEAGGESENILHIPRENTLVVEKEKKTASLTW